MSLNAICQRCGRRESEWTIREAHIHIGTIRNWKIQLCIECTGYIEDALIPLLGRRTPAGEIS